MPNKAFKADATLDSAFITKTFSPATSVYVQFKVKFPAAFIAALPGFSGDYGGLHLGVNNGATLIDGFYSVMSLSANPQLEQWWGSTTFGPILVGDDVYLVDYHLTVDGVNPSVAQMQINGVPYTMDAVPVFSQITRVDIGIIDQSDTDDVIFIDDVKIGTSAFGSTEIYSDDFEGGTLAGWTSTDGDVSVVTEDMTYVPPLDPWYTDPGSWPSDDDDTYYIDHIDTATLQIIQTIQPEDLDFTLRIREPDDVSYSISKSATDFNGDPVVSPDFIGPWRSCYQLRQGRTPISAGPITNAKEVYGEDHIAVAGRSWLHFTNKWEISFDGRTAHVNDYRIGYPLSGTNPPEGLAYQTAARNIVKILGDIVDAVQVRPNRIIFAPGELEAGAGTTTASYEVGLGDGTKVLAIAQDLADFIPGFDFLVSWDMDWKVWAPYRFGDPADVAASSADPGITYIVDEDSPIAHLSFENQGVNATHVNGRGAGLGSTAIQRAFGYSPGQVQFTRLDESYDLGDVKNATALVKKTKAQLSFDLNPVHVIECDLIVNQFTDFWATFFAGIALWIDVDLGYHHIDSAQRVVSIHCAPDDNGNAVAEFGINQIYDTGNDPGTDEG